MEEVDNIIIETLKDIGCHFDDDVSSLQTFSAGVTVEACVRCLQRINPDFQSPKTLPEAMSSRYRMCTNLANTVQAMGYPSEIGYQTFLYSSVKEWRKLLMFLIEKLPRDSTQASDEPMGAGSMLSRTIAAELALCLASPWTPPFCKKNSTAWSNSSSWMEGCDGVHPYRVTDIQAPKGTSDLTVRIPKDMKHYYTHHMLCVPAQPPVRCDLLTSLLEKNASEFAARQEWEAEWNQFGLASRLSEEDYRARKKQRLRKKLVDQLRNSVQQGRANLGGLGLGEDLQTILNSFGGKASGSYESGSRFRHAEKLQFAKDDEMPQIEEASEEELQQRREDEVASLQEQLAALTSQLETLDLNMKKYTASMQQMAELQTRKEQAIKEDKEAYKIKKQTFDLLPNAEENIAKLQAMIQASADRLAKLASKWEEVRKPLLERYRDTKAESENRESETSKMLEDIRQMRERMKEVADETRLKDDLHKQLVGELERMTKDLSRVSYTQRIMEIVMNIQRQKEDIGKILGDTRQVQKEINQLSGKLERIFTITDEQVYRDARKDEARRNAYKLLASLRENCVEVVDAIKETGQIRRDQRDLEEQIDNENSKKMKANLERISADHDQMKKENSQLTKSLKALS